MVRRHLNGDANELLGHAGREWQYDDPAEHEAALDLFYRFGLHLAEIDDWLDEPGWNEEARENFLEHRACLVRCARAGDDETARHLAKSLSMLMRQSQKAAAIVIPKFQRVAKKAKERENTGRKNAKKPADLPERIRAALASVPRPTNREVARRVGCAESTVRNFLVKQCKAGK